MKKIKEKNPVDLKERGITIREEIARILKTGKFSAKELSRFLEIGEKEVYYHLEFIKKSHYLKIEPSQCKICGFLFKKREKLKKPTKCPICKNEYILDPVFYIEPHN